MKEISLENIIFIALWLIFWFIIWKIYHIIKNKINEKEIRKDASKRSRSVILWEVYEKITPFLPGFKYNPKDLVFIWKWVDYIVFDWLSVWKLKNIVFLEVKSWKSNLNKNEKQIKNFLEKGKPEYEIYRI